MESHILVIGSARVDSSSSDDRGLYEIEESSDTSPEASGATSDGHARAPDGLWERESAGRGC